jgi:hypothetical protein
MLTLRTPIGLGAALSASLAASLLSAAPAQANTQAPGGTEFPGAADGSAMVQACSTSLGSTIFTDGFACQKGDKIYSSFFIIEDTNNALLSSEFLFSNIGNTHTLTGSGEFLAGTYEFGYTMTIFDSIASGNRLSSIRNDALNSANGDPNLVPAWTKTLTASTDAATIVTEASRAGLVETDTGNIAFADAVEPTSANFISLLVIDNLPENGTTAFSDTVTQKFADGETVPGPLPILGAAAAFGFSRKLRTRIKQTV